MEPNFKTIADLFAVPQPTEDLPIEEAGRKKHGETAEESDALGALHLRENNVAEAIRHFKEAIAQRPQGDITSQMNLAAALDYGEQSPQALRQYRRALEVQQDAAEPHVGLSDAYKRYGRFSDSIRELELAIEREPQNPYFRIKLAETLRDAGFPKRAILAAQAAVVAHPEEAFYHYWLGDQLITMGQDEEALESLRAAIELSPGDDHLFLRVAVPFWRLGRRAEAVKSVRLASDLDPEKHLYHGLLGIMLEEMDQSEEAQLESKRAEKMDRYDHEVLARLMAEMKIEA
ncbi:tetratricopeptide repeat protein [bacterium]|nr:MAG: tetratricopeptide repeat protein [bacterium]